MEAKKKLAIACQGGGSHTAFTAGVLKKLLEEKIYKQYELVGLSGTSGGGICATAAWYGLLKVAKGSSEPGYKWLIDFWKDNSANSCWEESLNDWTIQTLRLQELGLIPTFATSPYTVDWLLKIWGSLVPRREYFDFRQLLEKHIDFEEIENLVERSSPRLFLGAVDILSGEFKTFDSHQGEITVEAVMASAALPTLFRAVKIGKAAYWEGLFSENPPIGQFLVNDVKRRPDEIWVVRINPQSRATEPIIEPEIMVRRDELAGNLSLSKEIELIELVNRWVERGVFQDFFRDRVKLIQIRQIEMSPELSGNLDYVSKLNRASSFIDILIADGEKQAEKFLESLADRPV
jgi:NTE family protein